MSSKFKEILLAADCGREANIWLMEQLQRYDLKRQPKPTQPRNSGPSADNLKSYIRPTAVSYGLDFLGAAKKNTSFEIGIPSELYENTHRQLHNPSDNTSTDEGCQAASNIQIGENVNEATEAVAANDLLQDQQKDADSIIDSIKSLATDATTTPHHHSEEDFWRWKSILLNGFSLLLHGFGSKFETLQYFQSNFLNDHVCFLIYGFDTSQSFKDILKKLHNQLCPSKGSARNQKDALLNSLCKHLRTRKTAIYLVVHNIDAPALQLYQKHLARLASLPKVHLACSVDHFRFELLWDSVDLANFNFFYQRSISRSNYRKEVLGLWKTDRPSWVTFESTKSKQIEAKFDIVLKSSTKNHLRLIKIIAQRQLSNTSDTAVPVEDVLRDKHAAVMGMDQQKLDRLLVELTSHNVVQKCYTAEGKAALYIPADREYLAKLTKME